MIRTLRSHLAAALLGSFLISIAPAQQGFRYFYDGNGQLFRALDSSGNLLEYDYDASGNATAVRRSTVAPSSLAILNVVPQRGGAGSTVTIYGQNFNSQAAGDTVMFNGVAATVISATSTAIVVTVPGGVSTGPVSVTVGGNTATSGTLNFTVPNLPTITSMSPATGYDGQTLTVNVQGTNLTNANFQFLGAGGIQVTGVNIAGSTQASFTATIGQVGGNFVLVASNDFGISPSAATNANLFRVYLPPGDNAVSVRLSVFNTYLAPGSQPGVPGGSHAARQTLSVFNTHLAPGSEPGVPPGSNAVAQQLSVFNTYFAPGSEPGVPAGHNAATKSLSIFNSYLAPGSQPGVPAGSHSAFQLFSTNNSAVGVQSLNLSVSPLVRHGGTPSSSGTAANGITTLTAGQTVEIDIASPSGFLPELQFLANGAVLASSATGHLKTWFTVPYGVKSLSLQASGKTTFGETVNSALSQIAVSADSWSALSGLALDGAGRPAPGAALTWQANGLAADYYQFNQSLGDVPDLTGLTPARTAYVSALNFPNPQAVFGADPLGASLGQNYAVRFHGKLSIVAAGDYQFQWNAQAGGALRIDGVRMSAGAEAPLTAGDHEIEAVFYQSGDASPAAQLLWTPPGGGQGVVPPSALTTGAALAAGGEGRFQFQVPAVLSGVRVVLANGQGSVQLDQ